jgi:hypothetical protein
MGKMGENEKKAIPDEKEANVIKNSALNFSNNQISENGTLQIAARINHRYICISIFSNC